MSRSATRSRVAATQGRWSALASGWSSVRTLLWSSISGEIAKRTFATSSGPKRKLIIQLSLNLFARALAPARACGHEPTPHTGTAAPTCATSAACAPATAREIRRGALVRADALDRLSAAGWAALEAHGVRTVIDLRNDDELGTDAAPRPAGLTTLHLPLDGVEDTEFWQDWHDRPEFGTPLYYRPFLDHFPERTAAVFTAIARAEPGGIAVHCGIGRDRTGLITILLLALVGVDIDDITADYALSEPRVQVLLDRLAGGQSDYLDSAAAFYERAGTSAAEVIAALLAGLDVEAYLRAAGVRDEDLTAIRARLLSR